MTYFFTLLSLTFDREPAIITFDTSFCDNTDKSCIYYVCGTEITGVVYSIKVCDGNGYFFGFHHIGSLCHNIVTGIRISNIRPKGEQYS